MDPEGRHRLAGGTLGGLPGCPAVSLESFLTTIVHALDEAEIPFMLTGSLAAAFYGTPRATQDIDLVIEAQPASLKRLIDNLEGAGLYVDRGAAVEALDTAGQFNAIDPSSGWKADLIIRKPRDFSRTEFHRRRKDELFGIEVGLTTLEDLIIAKLEWSQMGDSELQRRDIRNLLELAGDSVDETYVIRWIGALGLQEAWDRVKGEAPG
jgi:hypothetical protein